MSFVSVAIVSRVMEGLSERISDRNSCSIACYKVHKVDHTDGIKPQTTAAPLTRPPASQSTVPASQTKSKRPNFSGLESDADLVRLMERYAGLRIQLQSVYGLTLEPHPDEPRQQRHTRGRGNYRGGFQARPSHGQWTKEKGDKEAVGLFRSQREGVESEGLEEFLQLLKMKYGTEQQNT